jgi:predicted metalloendopeptidase
MKWQQWGSIWEVVLGESIGDLAGAKIAWLPFQKAQQSRPAAVIEGLTPAQQFFMPGASSAATKFVPRRSG